MHDTTHLKGVLAPVVTPFKADLSPAPERFIAHCRWLLSQHVGLAVFGTNSEANSQSVSERMELLEALVAAGLDTTRMMPGYWLLRTHRYGAPDHARGPTWLCWRAHAAAVLLQGRQ